MTKKPISPTREMLELLESWAAPDVTETKQREYAGKTNFMGMPIEDMFKKNKSSDDEELEEEIKPLTAEEIEQIRADAQQEGFEQGKQEGIEAGFQEGLEKGHAEGSEQGYKEGYEAGYGQGKEVVDDEKARWQRLCQQLYAPIDKVDAIAEQQLLNLAVMLAETIVRDEVNANPKALMLVMHEAIASLPFNTEYAEIHMHPEDISYVEAEYDQDALVENKWILKPEPGYQRGDVIVMTPNSLIDRSVKQRLKQVLGTFVNKTDLEKELNDGPVSTPMPKMQEPTSESNAQHQADGNETVQVSSNEQNAEKNVESSDQESHVENEQGGE